MTSSPAHVRLARRGGKRGSPGAVRQGAQARESAGARIRHALTRAAASALILVAVMGLVVPQRPAARQNSDAASAVVELTTASTRHPLSALPQDFETVMGYAPRTGELADGAVRAIEPMGSCSSPFGGTRYNFTPVCKAHDLGYDLLRYAGLKGQPLGDDARRRLDDRFGQDLHVQCDNAGPANGRWSCHATAWLYAQIAKFNSWRQRYGVP